jgi:hypothetical protein
LLKGAVAAFHDRHSNPGFERRALLTRSLRRRLLLFLERPPPVKEILALYHPSATNVSISLQCTRMPLSALARVSGAVGLVARQLAAVGGDPVVCEILQPANRGQLVEGVRQPSAEGDLQRDIDSFGPSVTLTVGRNGPHVRLALLDAQSDRGRDAWLLVRHRRHAAVSVERLQQAHRPGSEPSVPVEYDDQVSRRCGQWLGHHSSMASSLLVLRGSA